MATTPEEFVAKVRATAERHGMFAPGQAVVVGVSGGPDSVALLVALTQLRAVWNLRLVAAHLNHGFRGAEAEADAEYVRQLADSLNVPVRIARSDVPARRRRQHLSAQEAARAARHEFLRQAAEETGAERIALGHTADDRIETILLNLLRGAGLEGLGGFPPVALPLVRPLYDLRRADTEACCAALALHPRADSSNRNADYRRNRIRTELLPNLVTYYNAGVERAILRMADLASADNEILETFAAHARERATLRQSDSEIVLDAPALMEFPRALQRRILRQAILHVRGELRNVGMKTVEAMLTALAERRRQQWTLPAAAEGSVAIQAEAYTLRIERVPPSTAPLPWRQELTIPGVTELPSALGAIESIICASAAEAAARAAGISGAHLCAMFRLRDVALPLAARSWQPGDRMRPRGLGGSKKLQDLFTDAKIPRADRLRIPVIAEAGGEGRILWVVGVAISEDALSPTDSRPGSDAGQDILLLRAETERGGNAGALMQALAG